jgi:putative transposase
LSYRQIEEIIQERGVAVAHSASNRLVVTYSPQLEAALHRRKRPVSRSWRMDKTYIKGKGHWRYLSRAVDTPVRSSVSSSPRIETGRRPYDV